MASDVVFQRYEDVPWYRRNWVTVVCFFLFVPGLLLIFATGTSYYKRKGEVRQYGMASRIFLIILSAISTLWVIHNIYVWITAAPPSQ